MVGGALVAAALRAGYQVRAMVRKVPEPRSLPSCQDLDLSGVEWAVADLTSAETLPAAVSGCDLVVHAAAKVGDRGPVEDYRAANVFALEHLVTAARHAGVQRWVQISSLGVYPARDHHGTDETAPIDPAGLDGYTRTKAEAEQLLTRHRAEGFPIVILRPGFIYGPGDRHVLPRLIDRIRAGKMKLFGDGQKLLNNTAVENLADAVLLALERPGAVGQTYNIRDARLVTKAEFVGAIADYLKCPRPGRIPLWLARGLASVCEGAARMVGSRKAPLVNMARYKFLGLNLDFSIAKAQAELGYVPRVDFREGIERALAAALR
jgi:nucleoside-diphosphate-sugar epimerase